MEKLIGKEQLAEFKAAFTLFYLGNTNAVYLALDILYVAHVWDDIIDDTAVSTHHINTAFRKLIYDIPTNPIMDKELNVILLSCYNQWSAANDIEDSGEQLDKAYMLRASIYQAFQYIAILV